MISGWHRRVCFFGCGFVCGLLWDFFFLGGGGGELEGGTYYLTLV